LTLSGTGKATDPFIIRLASPLIDREFSADGPLDLIDAEAGSIVEVTLDGDVTSVDLPAFGFGRFDLFVRQGAAAHAVTWPSEIQWPGGTPPTLTTTPGHGDLISFRELASTWIGFLVAGDIG
jgi:hypothetical protein